MRWVHEYGNLIYQIWKKKTKSAHFVWHLGVAPHAHQLKKLVVPQNEKNEPNSHK